MSNIEPTEEQKQAAFDFFAQDQPNAWHQDWIAGHVVPEPASNDEETRSMVDLARLLAEREAKLQARIDDLTEELAATDTTEMRLRAELKTEHIVAEKALTARNDMENERDALRARVVELAERRLALWEKAFLAALCIAVFLSLRGAP